MDLDTPTSHLEKLQIAAQYINLQKSLRSSAWTSIGWGVFTAALSLYAFTGGGRDPLTFAHLAIGAILIVEGLWILHSPQPKAVLAEAAVLLILGLSNTIGLYVGYKLGLEPRIRVGIVLAGLFQLLNAYNAFASYPFWRRIYPIADPGYIAEMEHLSAPIWKQSPNEFPDLIELNADSTLWKIKLLPEYALLVTDEGRSVELVERGEFHIEKTGETMLSKKWKVKVEIGETEFKSELSLEFFERYERWKSAGLQSAQSARVGEPSSV